MRLFEMFKGRKITPKEVVETRRRMYREAFGTEAGRFVLADLCDRYAICDSPFVKGDRDATTFRVGQQSVPLDILALLGKRTDPNLLNASMDGELGP